MRLFNVIIIQCMHDQQNYIGFLKKPVIYIFGIHKRFSWEKADRRLINVIMLTYYII